MSTNEDENIGAMYQSLGAGLDRTLKGAPLSNLNNAVRILELDPKLMGSIWFDEFLQRIMTGCPAREWTDADDLNTTLYIQRDIGLPKMGEEIVSRAVLQVAFKNLRNCAKDWLDALLWDEEPRIEHFFEDHYGAPGTEYARAAGRNFWLSMVARVYQPGCKVDNMVVLEGGQGIGKSRSLRVIGGDWFTEQHESIMGRGFLEVLQGKLLVEIGEMDSFNRVEVSRVKDVVSSATDRYRESYGRHAKDHPRQCVFVGTTNKDDWNKDETGARRFWPIACHGDIDVEAIEANRDQFFAEAVVRAKRGEIWWDMPTEATLDEQRKRYDADVWVEMVEEFMELDLTIRSEGRVTANQILTQCLKIDAGKISKSDQMRISTCLKVLGFRRRQKFDHGRCIKFWEKPEI